CPTSALPSCRNRPSAFASRCLAAGLPTRITLFGWRARAPVAIQRIDTEGRNSPPNTTATINNGWDLYPFPLLLLLLLIIIIIIIINYQEVALCLSPSKGLLNFGRSGIH